MMQVLTQAAVTTSSCVSQNRALEELCRWLQRLQRKNDPAEQSPGHLRQHDFYTGCIFSRRELKSEPQVIPVVNPSRALRR